MNDVYNLEKILDKIKDRASNENIRITQHAQQEMVDENINLNVVLEAISRSEILENYPEHRRGTCCLLNGTTDNGKNLHIVCTTSQPILIIITVYLPKPPKWVTPTQRRKKI
mgnify:CR=1 FL=1